MDVYEAERVYALAAARLERATEPEVVEREFALLREAAESGYAPAQYAYASCLDFICADSLGGVPFLIQAAQRGHADARHELYRRYVGQEKVRAFVRDRLTTEQIAALGLKEPTFFTRWFTPNENGNTPIAMLGGLLFIGSVGIYLARILAAWYEAWQAVEPADIESQEAAIMLLSVYLGAFLFCICMLVGLFLEFREAGSGAYHPLACLFGFLFIVYLMGVLLAWGWYEFTTSPVAEAYWWLPGTICTALGLVVGGFLLKKVAEVSREFRGGRGR